MQSPVVTPDNIWWIPRARETQFAHHRIKLSFEKRLKRPVSIQTGEIPPGYLSRQFKGTPPYWYQSHLGHVNMAAEMCFSTLHYQIFSFDVSVSTVLLFSEEIQIFSNTTADIKFITLKCYPPIHPLQ